MAKTEPRIPEMNIITQDDDTELVTQATISDIDALPDGSTYADIFSPYATLQIFAGTAAGFYVNTGSAAVPAFEEVAVVA